MTAGTFRLALLCIGAAAVTAAAVAAPVAILTTLAVVSGKDSGQGAAPRRDAEVFEQTGNFLLFAGEVGAVGFPIPYAEPPSVAISKWSGERWNESEDALVTEITKSGFKWKCVGRLSRERDELRWTAKGVKATTIQEHQR